MPGVASTFLEDDSPLETGPVKAHNAVSSTKDCSRSVLGHFLSSCFYQIEDLIQMDIYTTLLFDTHYISLTFALIR